MGKHEFTSIDIASVSGKAVIDGYMEKKKHRLRVNLDNPDVIIRTDVINDELFIGIDTTGDNALHKRWYRIYNHPAALNTTIACSMLKMAKWNKHKSLLDPMCGGGTIPIEAALMGRNIAIGKNRKFAYFNLFGEKLPVFEEGCDRMEIYGGEKFRKHLEGAIQNAIFAGVYDTIYFFQGDATEIDVSIDIILTNPPYGLRIGSKRIIEKLYKNFLRNVARILKERAVIITAESEILKKAAIENGFKIHEVKIKYGDLDASIIELT